MKSINRILALTCILAIGLISCGDGDFGDPQRPTQQLVNGLDLIGTFVDDGNFIFGHTYEFQKEGQLTQLCIMAPKDATYRVDLWGASSTIPEATVNIEADSGALACIDITAVQVAPGTRMGVTVLTTHYYVYDDNSAVIFPVTIGDVKILRYGTIAEPAQVMFPSQFFNDQLSGVVDLVFEPKLN